ncbi:MAG: class A beta-lactamase-related serine hydrolase [Propionibacteriales bacterium]|nr:class A beta-lactamase-related serine hydrolase [Propionibacteriales bacterium]
MTDLDWETDELATPVTRDIAQLLRRSGLWGGFDAANLDTGERIELRPDRLMPMASVAKLPAALVVLDRFATGRIDPATPVDLLPADRSPGPTGVSSLEHPVQMAYGDLVRQSLAVSDNAAADALFEVCPPREVTRQLRAWGIRGLTLRHPMRAIHQAMQDFGDPQVALELTVQAGTDGGGHPISELDARRANAGSAQALVHLLKRVWNDDIGAPGVAATLRERLGHKAGRIRMYPDLVTDAVAFRSKTGTFLNLRHEVGVVETEGQRIAVAALTASLVPAFVQPEAEAAIGQSARWAVEALLGI